ncbi:MAG: transglycosylase SLT domain-containing protein, partial [Candidatus Nanopelagicales bacterium]|nr:transglycosylase SLT domain-containing protein [Candidatus Nanopelagicales bacterium]
DTVTDKLKKTTKGEQVDEKQAEQKERKESLLSRFKNSLSRSDSRAAARKAEVEAEKKNAKARKGGGKKKSLLSSIIGGIGSAVFGGFKLVATSLGPLLGGLIGRSITGVLGTLLPKLVPGLASGTGSLIGKALFGDGLLKLGKGGLIRAGISGALTAAKVVGTAAVTGTAGMVLGGVLLAGAAIWGGYKLYKYLKRNDVAADIYGKLTRLRLLTYGYNDVKKDHYHRVFELEMLMKDKVGLKNGQVVFNTLSDKTKDDMLKLFEVERTDKDKYAIFNSWYMKRFLPGYRAFLSALWQARPDLYLDDLEKMSKNHVLQFASYYQLPVEVFGHKHVPSFEQTEVTVQKTEVEEMLNSIRFQAKEDTKENDPSTKAVSDANKAAAEAEKAKAANMAKIREAESKAALSPASEAAKEATKASNMSQLRAADAKMETTEDSEPPADKKSLASAGPQSEVPTAPTAKMAAGALEKGDPNSLPGISLNVAREKLMSVDPNMLELFTGMTKEYNQLTGKNIGVNEAFRSYEDQMRLHKQNPNKAAAPADPRTGKGGLHQYGLALDIPSVDAEALEKLGLLKKYGFTRPISGERWHIEPAGVSVDPAKAKVNMGERVKRVLSSPGRGGSGFALVSSKPMGKRNTALQMELYKAGTAPDATEVSKATENASETVLEPTAPTSASATQTPAETVAAVVPKQETPVPMATGEEIDDRPVVNSPYTAKSPFVYDENGKASMAPRNIYGTPEGEAEALGRKAMDKTPETVPSTMAGVDPGKIQDKPESVEASVDKAAQIVGVDKNTLRAFAQIESSMRPSVGNSQSSAKGLMQFMPRTWDAMLAKHGPKYNIPPDAQPTDPYYSAVLGAAYAKENLRSMGDVKAAGLREDTAMYLAHHFGPGGGRTILKALKANPNADIGQVVGKDAFNSNRQELSGKTVGGYIQYLNSKIDKFSGRKGSPPPPPSRPTIRPAPVRPAVTPDPVPSPMYGDNSEPLREAPLAETPVIQPKSVLPPPKARGSIQQNSDIFTPFPSQPVKPPLPQQGPSLSLEKTEGLLGGMSDTLLAIKVILEGIHQKGAMAPQGGSAPQTPAASPKASPSEQSASAPQQTATPVRTFSQAGVSLSRKPVNA